MITGRLEKWWDFELGLGDCCEVGASEMAETWDHSLEKMNALASSVLPQSGAGNHTGFEMWNRREKICLTRD